MPSLKPIQKNQKDDMKFTFDPAKCDRIFDEFLRNGYIKLSNALPSPEELKRRAWCKWHNFGSHATNNCNVFCQQIQSALNEGRLSLGEMQVGKAPFPMNMLECNNPDVLVQPEQAKSTAEKNVVIGEPRGDEKKYAHLQVALEKDEMGKNKLTITIRPSS
jgi:hypothetical protein